MGSSRSCRSTPSRKVRAMGAPVGQAGVTDRVAAELDRALTAHELIKVKVSAPDRDAREALCDEICERADAAEVQRVGKVLVLWRPRPEE